MEEMEGETILCKSLQSRQPEDSCAFAASDIAVEVQQDGMLSKLGLPMTELSLGLPVLPLR